MKKKQPKKEVEVEKEEEDINAPCLSRTTTHNTKTKGCWEWSQIYHYL